MIHCDTRQFMIGTDVPTLLPCLIYPSHQAVISIPFCSGRYYETKVIRRFNTILKRFQPSSKSVVIDMGANTAAHNHSVVGFEINPANIVRLCESSSINRYTDRIHIIPRGVSSVHGKPLLVYVPPHNPGEAQMVEPNQTLVRFPGTGQVVDINKFRTKGSILSPTITITLDQFAQDQGCLTHLTL